MKKKLIVSFSLLLGSFFLQAQTKTIAYQELKSASGALSGSGIFFGASMTTDSITVTFAGPSTKWIAVGFGTKMGGSDALIYTASGGSQDWWDYFMGSYSSVVKDVQQDWKIKSNTVSGSTRTLIASRKLNTGDVKDAVFNYNAASLNLIWARGSGSSFNLADHGSSNRAYGIALNWVTPDISADIIEISDKQYIKLTNSFITISVNDADYSYQISDLQGSIIKEKSNVKGELTINISEFKPAVYILTFGSNGKFVQRKFVVQ
jgi:hypothetical protein